MHLHIHCRNIWRVYPTNSEVDMESISSLSPLLPSGIQAAYENMNDQVFFFKGKTLRLILFELEV